jgi:hypothetical protein
VSTTAPIDAQQPQPFRGLSHDEKHRRSRQTHAQRAGLGETRDDVKKRRFSRRPLPVRELIEMTSEMTRFFHANALDERTRAAESKHYGVGYGVMIDKLNALSGRPTQVLGVVDLPRDGAIELGARLAEMARGA